MRKNNHGDNRGATMVEFVLTLPVFLMTIVGIMDYSQILTVQSLLDEAASRALVKAMTVPNFDYDPSELDGSSVEFKRLAMARQKSVDIGVRFLNGIGLLQPDTGSVTNGNVATLFNLRYDETPKTGAAQTITGGTMVLLPGDCATLPTTGQKYCNRASLGISDSDPAPAGSPATLMRLHPIRAIAVGEVTGYLPFFKNKIVVGEAFGYRQPVPQGPFPAPEDPELSTVSGVPAAELPPPLLAIPDEPGPLTFSCLVGPVVVDACILASRQAGQARVPSPVTCLPRPPLFN